MTSAERPVSTVLFVCHANTCRSVMAHALLERMLRERGVDDTVRVRSAGVGNIARDGMLASLDARLVLREAGVHLEEETITSTDLRRHRYLVSEAAVILTMTESQKAAVRALAETDGAPGVHPARVRRRRRRHRGSRAAGRGQVPRMPRRDSRLPG